MPKAAPCLALLLGLAPAVALAQLAPKVDARGVIQEVRLDGEVFLTDLAVSVEKPGWRGRLADQRAIDPATVRVRRDGPTTFYAAPIQGDDFTGRLIQRVTRRDGELVLDYEVFPDHDVEIEAVVLQFALPADRRAGGVSFRVDGDPARLLPAEPGDGDPLLWRGEPKWLEWRLEPAGRSLRLAPRDAGIQLLHLRDRNAPAAFAIRATAGGGEHLARKPIHLGLTLRAGDSAKPGQSE